MASLRAVAERRAKAIQRQTDAAQTLSGLLNLPPLKTTTNNKDVLLAEVEKTEAQADYLEALVAAVQSAKGEVDEEQVAETLEQEQPSGEVLTGQEPEQPAGEGLTGEQPGDNPVEGGDNTITPEDAQQYPEDGQPLTGQEPTGEPATDVVVPEQPAPVETPQAEQPVEQPTVDGPQVLEPVDEQPEQPQGFNPTEPGDAQASTGTPLQPLMRDDAAAALIKAGFTTLEAAAAQDDKTLLKIKGVGHVTVEVIRSWASTNLQQ